MAPHRIESFTASAAKWAVVERFPSKAAAEHAATGRRKEDRHRIGLPSRRPLYRVVADKVS
jgi:hypothetical protein